MWVRLIPVLLVLSTVAAAQAVAAARDGEADCAGDEGGCDCTTCVCACCPSRAPLLALADSLPAAPASFGAVYAPVDEPVAATWVADIFQPPRA